MMGPLVILAILTKKPQGWFMILISGIGLMVFVLSEAGILPKMVGGFRMDLFLMMCLALCGFGNYLVKK
jgi:SSS family solute:Na+ symporter